MVGVQDPGGAPGRRRVPGHREADELKAGNIDAMFYVAGYPVKLLAEDVVEEDKLRLSLITNRSVIEFYPQAEIPANTYSWHKESSLTVSVRAALISYDFRGENCEHVGKFAQLLADNIDWLKTHGHPKWKSVKLHLPLKGWEQYDCVKNYLVKRTRVTKKRAAGIDLVLKPNKDMMGD